MGFRFRKTIKLFPCLKINLSNSGVSMSIGEPGATINISNRGTRGTMGIPGTGISYNENLSHPSHLPFPSTNVEPQDAKPGMGLGGLRLWGILGLFGFLLVHGFLTR